jgi:hypothetical protein
MAGRELDLEAILAGLDDETPGGAPVRLVALWDARTRASRRC